MCVIVRASPRAGRRAFGGRKNIGLCILFAHTQKHTHILVTAPLYPHTDAAPYIPVTTQKRPTFRQGAIS